MDTLSEACKYSINHHPVFVGRKMRLCFQTFVNIPYVYKRLRPVTLSTRLYCVDWLLVAGAEGFKEGVGVEGVRTQCYMASYWPAD